jgi:hypothetical protein
MSSVIRKIPEKIRQARALFQLRVSGTPTPYFQQLARNSTRKPVAGRRRAGERFPPVEIFTAESALRSFRQHFNFTGDSPSANSILWRVANSIFYASTHARIFKALLV